MGPYELGVTNALWQKAFTPEWEATRRQAGGKVKRCVAVFDVLIPLNVYIYYKYICVHCMYYVYTLRYSKMACLKIDHFVR